jgi:hypothetical protein
MNSQDIKLASERRLRSLGVIVNEHLPTIAGPAELKPRSARDVSARARVLSHVIAVGYGRSGKEMLEWVAEAKLTGDLTRRESEFLKQKKYSAQDRAWAAWQFAAAHGCAWALGLEEMKPLEVCPNTLASHFPPKRGVDSGAALRAFAEIYSEADFYYRLHWAARQARLEGSEFPLPEFEIQLRRQSLDWIVGVPYEWDDVPSDT